MFLAAFILFYMCGRLKRSDIWCVGVFSGLQVRRQKGRRRFQQRRGQQSGQGFMSLTRLQSQKKASDACKVLWLCILGYSSRLACEIPTQIISNGLTCGPGQFPLIPLLHPLYYSLPFSIFYFSFFSLSYSIYFLAFPYLPILAD